MAGGHGGRRAGAGRPHGISTEKASRRSARERAAEEATQYLQSNGSRIFEGDAFSLLTAAYKNEELPEQVRFNAALACLPYERARMSEARITMLELRAKEESEEERNRRVAEGDRRLDDLFTMWGGFVADRETEIRELLDAGEITLRAAEAIRRWHLKPELPLLPAPSEPASEPNPPPHDTAEPESPNRRISPLPRIDPARAAPVNPAPWLDGSLDKPARPIATVVVLYAKPYQNFWIGRPISADEFGEIRVAAADIVVIEALLRSGCTTEPGMMSGLLAK
jgi:hypothetical protein